MKSKATDRIELALNKEASLVATSAVFVVFLLALYLIYFGIFQRLPLGGPTSWAEFGDFFGGIVNPVIGIVTVILVVRTLKATREEAEATRAQLEQQLEHQREERILGDMRVRLERTLDEWKRGITAKSSPLYYCDEHGSYRTTPHGTSIEEALSTPGIVDGVDKLMGMEPSDDKDGVLSHWASVMAGLVPLLEELACYCTAYQQRSKLSGLPDYYRRRVINAARILQKVGLLSAEVAASLESPPLDIESLSLPHPGVVPAP